MINTLVNNCGILGSGFRSFREEYGTENVYQLTHQMCKMT